MALMLRISGSVILATKTLKILYYLTQIVRNIGQFIGSWIPILLNKDYLLPIQQS